MQPLVQLYPPSPGAERSREFSATVNGRAAFVEHYADVSYVRFAFEGRVDLAIAVEGAIGEHRVFPDPSVARAEVRVGRLHLELEEPSSFVVWIGDREKLFVLADPVEAEPAPRGNGVFVVEPGGADARTAELQAALDLAGARPGGGTVHLPAGRYRTGTLSVGSDVTLHLAPGALLEGLADPAAFPVDPGFRESGTDATLDADPRFFGRTMTFSRLLLVDGAAGARICGRGTISGSGATLRREHDAVPNLVRVRSSRGVRIDDVLLRDAAAWTLHILASDDVTVSNIKILNDRGNLNTDGIDPDMSSHVRIDRAFVYTKDDAVCVKATRNGDLAGDVRDVRVTRSVLSSRDAALKLGSESDAERIEDVDFEDCWVFETGRAMSIVVRDGAACERIAFRRIHVGPGVDHLVEQSIGVRPPAAALGTIRDLLFEDVVAPEYPVPAGAWTWYAQFRPGRPGPDEAVAVFEGADADHAVDGLCLRRVVVNGRHLVDADVAREAAGLTFGPFTGTPAFE